MASGIAAYDVNVPRTIHEGPVGRRPPAWWGMICLVATEAALFFFLLYSYFYMATHSSVWPPEGPPDLKLALPNTALLLASSATMWWAESGIRAGRSARLRIGLVITIVLGAVFAAVQGLEWSQKPFGPATDAYGSLFFTITGFHGAHVIVGLIILAYILLRASLGHFTAERHLAVSTAAIYWHFVDVVWLFVFTSLFLTPRL